MAAKALHVLTVIGARPQIIKAAAVSRAMAEVGAKRVRETLLHTGQHYDHGMSQVFFDELGIPRPDVTLGVGSASHGVQTARMIEGIERELLERRPDVVLLYGDTNSTLAGAVAAAKLHVPVAHVEAGLRSFNKAMPEEVNRIVCDHCSTWLFCPTDTAMRNLAKEGFTLATPDRPTPDDPWISMCGDVMLDNSLHFAALAQQRSTLLRDHGLEEGGYVLATVHRDHNTDAPARLAALLEALLGIRAVHRLPVVLPLHPRTRRCMDAHPDRALMERVTGADGLLLLPPAGFLDMIALERSARLIITDSGGVQKEAFFFGRPCVILRPETEWVELLAHGQAVLADADVQRIADAAARFIADGAPACPPLFGDGHAARRVVDELCRSMA